MVMDAVLSLTALSGLPLTSELSAWTVILTVPLEYLSTSLAKFSSPLMWKMLALYLALRSSLVTLPANSVAVAIEATSSRYIMVFPFVK